MILKYHVITGEDTDGSILTVMVAEDEMTDAIEDFFVSGTTKIKDEGVVTIEGRAANMLPSWFVCS